MGYWSLLNFGATNFTSFLSFLKESAYPTLERDITMCLVHTQIRRVHLFRVWPTQVIPVYYWKPKIYKHQKLTSYHYIWAPFASGNRLRHEVTTLQNIASKHSLDELNREPSSESHLLFTSFYISWGISLASVRFQCVTQQFTGHFIFKDFSVLREKLR